MQITDVKATLHRIPIEAPLLKERIWTPVLFPTVNTDQGISGYGLTRAAQRHGAKEFINREAAPFLRGKNPVETERIWHELYKTFNPRAQTGMWSSAVSAIDIALWDIKGKYYKEPVWRLLGGAQNPVPAYVTFGLKQYTKDQLAEVAKSFVAKGEHRLKMVVAVEPENPSVDAERVRTVREAVGEKVELMIDANYLFSFNRALELCKLVEPCGITWFEEPVYQNDAHLLADLRRHTSIPIAAGQNEGHRFRHRRADRQSRRGHRPTQRLLGGWLHRSGKSRGTGAGFQFADRQRRRLAASQHAFARRDGQRMARGISP